MKKAVSIILSLIVIISSMPFCVVAKADDSIDVMTEYNKIVSEYDDKSFIESIIIQSDKDEILLNGAETSTQSELEIVEDTAMVSLDALCEYSGAELKDDSKDTGYSIVEYEDRDIWFDTNSGVIDVVDEYNDDFFILDQTPIEKDDNVIVPLYDFAEVLGYEVYEEDNNYLLTRPYQTNRLLVSTKKDIDSLNSVEEIRDEENDITILQFDNETDTIDAQQYYDSLSDVSCEPDIIMSTNDDDMYIEKDLVEILESHGKHRAEDASELIHVDDMNDYLATQKLSDVTVAVIDTGVDSTHPDLKDRVRAANVNFSDSPQDNSVDDQGHGTHVSGIILDNSLDTVKVLAVKVLDNEGRGTLYQVTQGMNYAAEQGVKAMNLSLGAYGESDLMNETAKKLCEQNISVIVAAGNESFFARVFTPANIPECITVSALDNKKRTAGFENYGYPVDIEAPGVAINSTWPLWDNKYNGYKRLSGTSMATPFVTAVVSTLYSYDSKYTQEYIHEFIKEKSQEGPHTYRSGSIENGKYWYYGVLDCSYLIDVDRASVPQSNIKSGYYSDYIDVELFNNNPNAKIYYTTDGSRATQENGTLYTKPIHIEYMTRLHAVSYVNGVEKSLQTYWDYYVVNTLSEKSIMLDDEGFIIGYTPDDTWTGFSRIPEKINGRYPQGIRANVFKDDLSLILIWLPNTIKTIEDNAFYGCKNLLSIQGNGVKSVGKSAFYSCQYCKSFQFPYLETIGEYSFYGCNHVNSINYKYLTNEIPDYAFYNCWSIQSISLGKISLVGYKAFYGCSGIPYFDFSETESISEGAFSFCVMLESLNAPKLKKLSPFSFQDCISFVSVSIPNYVGPIPKKCFYNCYSIREINIPHVTLLDESCFEMCKNIKAIVMNECEKVATGALLDCNNLERIELDSAKIISGFSGAKVEIMNFPNCEQIGTICSDTVKYVSLPKCERILSGIKAPKLISAYLPKLKEFGRDDTTTRALFEDCDSIEEVSLPLLEKVLGEGWILYYNGSISQRNISLERINVPSISNSDTILQYTNKTCKFQFLKDLPKETSSNKITIDFSGYNLSYQWYYSPTGEGDSFVKLDNEIHNCFYPENEGYYYVAVRQFDWGKERNAISQVCHYTHKSTEKKSVTITGTEAFDLYANGTSYSATKKSGTYQLSVDVPDGDIVTVHCDKSSFVSWLDNTNRSKSINNDYSFKVSDNVQLTCNTDKARLVSFYNANGDLIQSKTYLLFYERYMPEAPTMYGYKFVGWSMTADEINTAVRKGQSVSVYAKFVKETKYYDVHIYNGTVVDTTSDQDNGENSYRGFSTVSIQPDDKYKDSFVCWKDMKGNVISYNPNYSFYVTGNTSLVAIYGEEVKKIATTNIVNAVIDKENKKITFIAERDVPEEYDVISHGIIMTNDTELNDETFVIGAEGVLKGTSVTTANRGTYTLYKSNVVANEPWLARSYVIYGDDNHLFTEYSPIYIALLQ